MIEPTKKVFSLAEEFRNFALKGNVIDMAVGIIIGGAFGGIVKSLVEKIIMPLISVVLPSNQSYTKWSWTPEGTTKAVEYGQFLGEVVNFVVVALVLFIFVVKFLGFIMRTKHDAPPPPPTKDQELLSEIRDLLKTQQGKQPSA
jgi:large conductance mechanosensitive channel